MSQPPQYLIDRAVAAASDGPCAKSKRGVIAYIGNRRLLVQTDRLDIVSVTTNGPPAPMRCDGSADCKRSCSKIAVHAEQAVIMEALQELPSDDVFRLHLLHVKVVNGALVAGGPPSCWQCSRLLLHVGVAGIWLFEDSHEPSGAWKFRTALEFHKATLANCGLHAGGT